jgi:hypothetical protein
MNFRIYPSLTVIMAIFFLCASAHGATYYVATTGVDTNDGSSAHPWATIQKAVDTIANGDTIVVRDGTYVGARIESSGTSGAPKTLMSANKWGAKINAPSSKAKHNGNLELENYDLPLSYWVVDGFEVDGQLLHRCIDIRGTAGTSSTAYDPAHHITIQNCHVHHAKNGAGVSTGIFDGNHSYASYLNNVTHDNTEHGIYHSNSSQYATITGNVSYNNAGCGYHNNGDVSLGLPGVIQYVAYEKNVAYGNSVSGGGGINLSAESDSVYKNNLLYGNFGNGMTFYQGEGTEASSRNKTYNNTIVMPSNGRYCILLGAGASNDHFFNNILYNAHAQKGSYTLSSPTQPGFQSDYNIVVDGFNTDNEDTIGGTSFAAWQGLGYDTHSVHVVKAAATLTALFLNATNSDYHLIAGSPAIDAGKDLSGEVGTPDPSVTGDMDGRARPVNGVFDIGCYEYSGVTMVAKPSFNPAAGSYSPSVDVTITCATASAEIRYTLDGNDPTQTSSLYSGPVNISSSATLKARAFKAAMDPSSIATGVYTIGGAETTVTLQEGLDGYTGWEDTWLNGDSEVVGAANTNYGDWDTVHLQFSTPDRQLHRFDISSLSAGQTIKSATLSIYVKTVSSGTPTVSAYRVKKHWVEMEATYNKATSAVAWATPGLQSPTDYDATVLGTSTAVSAAGWFSVDITSAVDAWYRGTATNEGVMLKLATNGHLVTYTSEWTPADQCPKVVIVTESTIQKVAKPTLSPDPGSFVPSVDVAIDCATSGAEIRYTTDGNDPSASSPLYSSAIHVTTTTLIKAGAFKSGMTPSDIASGTYDISGTVATPSFSPGAGTYGAAVDVAISCLTSGATIYYTTNNSAPDTSSTAYVSGSPVHIAATTTLKAIALKAPATDSAVATALYRIDTQAPVLSGIAAFPTTIKAAIDLSVTVTASASDSSTGNSHIVAAEYYKNVDGGAGHNTPMNALDGSFNSSEEALTVNINTTSWAAPTPVTIGVRAQDAALHWSDVQTIIIPVVSSVPPGQVTDLTAAPNDTYVKYPLTVEGFSSESFDMTSANLLDGDPATAWQSVGTGTIEDEWVTVDLASVQPVAAVTLGAGPTAALFPKNFTIEVSEDLATWTTVAVAKQFKARARGLYLWEFPAVDARYVRVSTRGAYYARDQVFEVQLGEIQVPSSLTSSLVSLTWTAPAEDDYTGSPATAYDVRYSLLGLTSGNFATSEVVTGIGAPSAPGTTEEATCDIGDDVGRVFVALKAVDSIDNWSLMSNVATTRTGGARIASNFPGDSSLVTANSAPAFFFGAGNPVKSLTCAISTSPAFPPAPIARPSGEIDRTLHYAQKPGATSWKVSAAQWKAIKKIVLSDRVLFWRLEGKTLIGKSPTAVYGPTRSVYFATGSFGTLSVAPVHDVEGTDGVYPDVAVRPTFSWVNTPPNVAHFFVDVSSNANVPLGDKLHTATFGAKGISTVTYQLLPAEWKKLRQLATIGQGTVYWRVRGADRDGMLACGSGIEPLIIDGGLNAPTGPANVSATPAVFNWSHAGTGITGYYLQFSVDDTFEAVASSTVRIPAKSVAATTYTLLPADVLKLNALARRNVVGTLYYRVRGEDAERAFVAASDSATISVP